MNKNLGTLIPVYNAENYLYYCVNSVLEQNPNEIILVDDGSTDKSAEICDEYALQEAELEKLAQESQKLVEGVNIPMLEAKLAPELEMMKSQLNSMILSNPSDASRLLVSFIKD